MRWTNTLGSEAPESVPDCLLNIPAACMWHVPLLARFVATARNLVGEIRYALQERSFRMADGHP